MIGGLNHDRTGPSDAWLLSCPEEDDGPEDCDLTRRMLDAGYDWDGETWSRTVRTTIRVARRAHHGIAVGQRYREVVTIYVDDRGRGSRSRSYRVLA